MNKTPRPRFPALLGLATLLSIAGSACTADNPDYNHPTTVKLDGGSPGPGTGTADLSVNVQPGGPPDLAMGCQGADCNCGGPKQACCAGNTCNNGGCCLNGTCAANGDGCGVPGYTCKNGSCSGANFQCGNAGEACCPSGFTQICTGAHTVCDQSNGRGTCVACGGDGQACCDNKVCDNGGCCNVTTYQCAAPGSGCGLGNGAVCAAPGSCGGCGAIGQDCCQTARGDVFCVEGHTVCKDQQDPTSGCQRCGGNGQPCCPPNYTCEANLACRNGTCR